MTEIARAELRAAIGLPCPYCGSPMTRRGRRPSRDHVLPKSAGGTFADPSNRLIVCAPCNEDKGRWSLAAFAAALEADGDARAERVRRLVFGLQARRPSAP